MRKPEAYLNEIEKLRAKHSSNAQSGNWNANHGVRSKIITAWEGYHAAIDRLLDKAGCAVGNEHEKYSQPKRIKDLAGSRDYFMKETDKARALLAKHDL